MTPAEHRARIIDMLRLVEATREDEAEATRARHEAEALLRDAQAAYRGEMKEGVGV